MKRKSMRPRKGRKSKRSLRKSRKGRRTVSTAQLQTLNASREKVMVFEKTALYNVNGVNLLIGANLPVTFIGGAIAASMPDWGNITALFNRYKMLKVTYTFNLVPNGLNQSLNTDRLPKILCRYNYDSNLTASQVLSKMQEISDVKDFQFTADKTVFSYSYYPRCIEPVYLSSVSTGYKLAKPQFIDVQYGTVPHYGLMFYIDFLDSQCIVTYDISYKIAFKYEA